MKLVGSVRRGLSAFSSSISRARDIWSIDDPLPSLAEFFLTLHRFLELSTIFAPSKSIEPRPREGRSAHSYPVRVPVKFQVLANGQITRIGTGIAFHISSAAILIKTSDSLPPGTPVRVLIDWPASIDSGISLVLEIAGRTTLSSTAFTEVEIEAHEFRASSRAKQSFRTVAPRLAESPRG